MIKKTMLAAILFVSIQCFAQKKDSTQMWNEHIDSVLRRTSVAQFIDFVQSIATVKQYQEVKLTEAYTNFIQAQYNAWLAPKAAPKK
jgi:methyltransferase-like protein